MRMVNSKLYRQGAIQRGPPLLLTVKFYWKSLIGTCGAWFVSLSSVRLRIFYT